MSVLDAGPFVRYRHLGRIFTLRPDLADPCALLRHGPAGASDRSYVRASHTQEHHTRKSITHGRAGASDRSPASHAQQGRGAERGVKLVEDGGCGERLADWFFPPSACEWESHAVDTYLSLWNSARWQC